MFSFCLFCYTCLDLVGVVDSLETWSTTTSVFLTDIVPGAFTHTRDDCASRW
jgi:hypothetical protein